MVHELFRSISKKKLIKFSCAIRLGSTSTFYIIILSIS